MKARNIMWLAALWAGLTAMVPTLTQAQDKKDMLGQPGPEHKRLEALAGTYTARVRAYLEPGKPPHESTGKMTRTLIFGGRYLQEEYTGQMAGQTFSGKSIIGYDKNIRRYRIVWIDSASTEMMINTGTWDEKTKSFNFVNYLNPLDPSKGKKVLAQDVLWVTNPNEQRFEMYRKPLETDAKPVKILEILYTRQK